MKEMSVQEAYCKYLRDWADTHSGIGFLGNEPECFELWNDCKRHKIQTPITNTYFLQVKSIDWNSPIRDTVALHIPASVSEGELLTSITDLAATFDGLKYESEGRLDMTNAMLNELVYKWKGSWDYLHIFGVAQMNDCVFTFIDED